MRKLGGTTLRSIGQIARLQRIADNDAEYVTPLDMLAELREDNQRLAASMRAAHGVCDEHGDVATASLLEVWIDEAERRVWFLFEASRRGDEPRALACRAPRRTLRCSRTSSISSKEEHKLFERGEPTDEESQRLAALQVELDQCWDLLRQRRALREFGGDPSQAHARDADVVKKYSRVSTPAVSPTLEARRAQTFPVLTRGGDRAPAPVRHAAPLRQWRARARDRPGEPRHLRRALGRHPRHRARRARP